MKLHIRKGDFKHIDQALGLDGDLPRKLGKSMARFFEAELLKDIKRQIENGAADGLVEHKGVTGHMLALNVNKLDLTAKYLESVTFKSLGWVPETANDFFFIGFMVNKAEELATKSVTRWLQEQADDFFHERHGVDDDPHVTHLNGDDLFSRIFRGGGHHHGHTHRPKMRVELVEDEG